MYLLLQLLPIDLGFMKLPSVLGPCPRRRNRRMCHSGALGPGNANPRGSLDPKSTKSESCLSCFTTFHKQLLRRRKPPGDRFFHPSLALPRPSNVQSHRYPNCVLNLPSRFTCCAVQLCCQVIVCEMGPQAEAQVLFGMRARLRSHSCYVCIASLLHACLISRSIALFLSNSLYLSLFLFLFYCSSSFCFFFCALETYLSLSLYLYLDLHLDL